jgi:8-oxo-dGTP pyrophosphatase MutT (NUDIX family)
MIKNNICNNCGKQGHMFHQCKLPITSYGIILFRYNNNNIEYLMLRRKDSFGFIDLLRGKYVLTNLEQIQSIFNEMSMDEKKRVLNENFPTLWKNMWGETTLGIQYKSEEFASQKKFETLKEGFELNGITINIDYFINNSTTNWNETEWEFPKGRRNHMEKDLTCALREFEEETGISKHSITIIDNMLPLEEIFIGSNHKSYKHKYYLAFMENNVNSNINNISHNYYLSLDNFQRSEVSKLEWKNLENCLESIRPYSLEKKRIIQNVNKILEEYRLY